MKLGARIKELRVKQRISLSELAKKIGLTTSFLSQLERDITSPSVNSLEKIARALDVKVADFFQEGKKKELIIVKKGAGRQRADKKHKILTEILASGVFDVNMQSQLFSLGPGAVLMKELDSFQGEKFLMVLKGAIEFSIGEERFLFEEGDSIYCAYSQNPYKIINIGKKETKVLYISFLQ